MGTPPGRRLLPRLKVVVATGIMVSFASLLLVGAYTGEQFTPDAEHGDTLVRTAVPRDIQTGGPVINADGSTQRSYHLPPMTIALTFDDGPDPTWTPAILAVLRRHHVNATFFVLGERVAEHPDIARRLAADGNELGVHTFTHPDLSQLRGWRRDIELSLTQLAIAGATGRTTSLLREPYSSGASSIDNPSWSVIREAGRAGYLTVVADNDSRDWAEHDVHTIVRNATPDDGAGSVVLWHDAGGDRSRTVAALDTYIPRMLARGYRFTTVSEGLRLALAASHTPAGAPAGASGFATGAAAAGGDVGAPAVVGTRPAAASVVWRGRFVVWTIQLTQGYFGLLWLVFVTVGALTVGRTLLLFCFAGHHVRRRRHRHWSWSPLGAAAPPVTLPVSVVIPAYNEAKGIAAAVRSLAGGDYPTIEVIVVDDGSTDDTADRAEALGLPNVRVIRTPNGGKPAALNTGIQAASHDLIVMVDGDTVFEPSSIHHLVQPFADPQVGAVSGNVKIGNRSSMVARWQHIEYVIGFNLDRRMYDTLHCMPTVPGAIGAFRRTALFEVGGVSDDTLAEDTDLTMALCRAGWHVVYEERARAWTEAPATVSQLWKQRYRWSYGTMQAMWKHRRALRERTTFGLVGLPMLAVFGILLPMLAPMFDVLTVYGAFALDAYQTIVAWLAMLAVQALTAVIAFRLDGERLRPLWALPLQQFMYRQTMYLVALQSMITAFTGARLRWHKLRRTGLHLAAESIPRQLTRQIAAVTTQQADVANPTPAAVPVGAPTAGVAVGAAAGGGGAAAGGGPGAGLVFVPATRTPRRPESAAGTSGD